MDTQFLYFRPKSRMTLSSGFLKWPKGKVFYTLSADFDEKGLLEWEHDSALSTFQIHFLFNINRTKNSCWSNGCVPQFVSSNRFVLPKKNIYNSKNYLEVVFHGNQKEMRKTLYISWEGWTATVQLECKQVFKLFH